MNNTLIRELFENAVHFGHKCQKWNPKMKSFIYGKRYDVHIFDLGKTAVCLEKACQFLEKSSKEGKSILIISTKPQCESIVRKAAQKYNIPYVTGKWISGLLTNFETIKKRIKYFRDLIDQEESGELGKYPKNEQQKLKKEKAKLETALGGVKELRKLPEVIVIIDTVRDIIAVEEAKKLKIPVVAIVDSNANPSGIDYPIPANDDAIKSLKFLVGKLVEAIEKGKKLNPASRE